MFEIPITSHPELPDEVQLVADFHDMRNRLSYYYPILREMGTVNTPITKFFPIEGDKESYLSVEYREVTRFMQDISAQEAFIRGDFSSAKYEDEGRHIESQDPYDIETVFLEMVRQLARGDRHIGGRVAVREWIPPAREVRFFLSDGEILYADSVEDDVETEWPWVQARHIARQMDNYAWSCDFIEHEKTGKWYCIDMGLDGLHYIDGYGWCEHSEHLDDSMSPRQFTDAMPTPETFNY
jgi:hypothetical protein